MLKRALLLLVLAGLAFAAWVAVANRPLELPPAPDFVSTPALIERGAYLARAGNCAGCHTARGGTPFAGGRGIETPFGKVQAGNLTPHATGLGGWTADHFFRALHEGRAKDGRLLYPAFPYPAFTQVTRADSDALFAYLQSLPPVDAPARPHDLRWPTNQPWALATWRALFFRPEPFVPEAAQSPEWNRGAYLVRGLGHCASCHAPRNALGATLAGPSLGGGEMPGEGWHAPALGGRQEGAELAQLLRTGQSARGTVLGPMAEVVLHSTQHLSDADLNAMAAYLASQPEPHDLAPPGEAPRPDQLARGARLYETHCATCHGADGSGQGLYPPLSGNRTVNLLSPNNVLKVIHHGGFAPATQAQPRPFGMPPFAQVLNDAEVAAVATHVRRSWGNAAPAVSEVDVARAR